MVKDPWNLSEAQILTEVLTSRIKGEVPRAADLLGTQYLAVERPVMDKNDWKHAKDYELRREVTATTGRAQC